MSGTGPGGLEVGVVYPQNELGGDPDAARLIGDAVERLGFSHLVAYDHVLGADHERRDPPLLEGGYDQTDPFHDPFVLFAYLAARTERIDFCSGVLIMPQRQTAVVARQAADLALLSGGRFRLGVGVGWNHVEYDALGVDFATRGRRLDEQIGLLRELWSGEVVDHHGRFDRVDRAALVPAPARRIPILVGGFSEPALRRSARLGDGFLFAGSLSRVTDQWAHTQDLLIAEDRDPQEFAAEYLVRARKGTDDLAERIERWAAVDGTRAAVVTLGLGLDSAKAHVDYLTEAAERLGVAADQPTDR